MSLQPIHLLVVPRYHGFSRLCFMPCPFTGPKNFWAGPNFLCHSKNLFTYCGSQNHFCSRQTDNLHSVKLVFVPVQMFLKKHYLNAVKFLGQLKKFGQAQNILGNVKGQGIDAQQNFSMRNIFIFTFYFHSIPIEFIIN